MLDHFSIYTSAALHEATVAFYLAALAPLGYQKIVDILDGQVVGLGVTSPDFWISSDNNVVTNAHFAFRADELEASLPVADARLTSVSGLKDQSTVDKCYAKGLETGGRDNGKPGLRPQYGPGYYGGYLYDPIGNGMEIVHRGV
ncbi:hypothetical protein MMC11_004706 [Xylographa trunciseda]|nr:hypothetical protein [Xylographa trunciseda]